ncbi:MAG: YceI family protein [Pyrinomonadaceae bacterium]
MRATFPLESGRNTGRASFCDRSFKKGVFDVTADPTTDSHIACHCMLQPSFRQAAGNHKRGGSTAIRAGGYKGTHTVTGNLTMHGVTKSITFPATITGDPDAVRVDSTFSINRKTSALTTQVLPIT